MIGYRSSILVLAIPALTLACNFEFPQGEVEHSVADLDTELTLEYAEVDRGHKAVIFLHGYTDSWFSYSEVLERLPWGYHGYSISQRGHGDSDRPLAGYAMSDFADDVDAFMELHDIDHATIVGHSMGSVIAQRFALDYPDRVDNLVLIGASAMPGNETVLGLNEYVQAEVSDPVDPAFVADFQLSTLAQPVPQDFIDTVIAESLKVPAFVWKAALGELVLADYRGELADITAPTLIVWGDQDTIFGLADQQELEAGIPDATLLIYEGFGHGVHWEDPDRFTDDLLDFIHH